VDDVKKAAAGQLHVHSCRVTAGTLRVGQAVSASVDATQRRRLRAHHTATHLLQSALKQVGPLICLGERCRGMRLTHCLLGEQAN
jgi:alanyl-tRNA synthetase